MYLRFLVKFSKLCNLRCTYCYEMPELANPAKMSLAELETMFLSIREYVETHGSVSRIHYLTFYWQGGEPFIQPLDYWETIFALQNQIYRSARRRIALVNIVQTNLTLMREEHVDMLRRYGVQLGFSYDVINHARVDRRRQLTSDRVENKIQWLLHQKLSIQGNAVITKGNIDQPKVIARFFLDRNVPFLALVIDEGKEVLPGPTEATAEFTSYLKFFVKLHQLPEVQDALQRGTFVEPLTSTKAQIERMRRNHPFQFSESDCHEMEWVLVVNTNGEVYSQGDHYNPGFSYGNIFSQSFSELLTSNGRKERVKRSADRIQRVCHQCFLYRKSCNGVYVSHALPAEFKEYEKNRGCYVGLLAKTMMGQN